MRDSYLAARVLDALLREDYGDISAQITRSREGVGLTLSDGRLVRLAPGVPFQDFVVAPGQLLGLEQVLDTLAEIAPEEDADGVKAFFDECVAALAALDSHDARLPDVLARDPSYETLAAFADHPGYPTARARPGVPDGEQAAYAPEFGPAFELRWAVVPRRDLEPGSAELPPDVLTWEPDEPRSEPSDEAHPPVALPAPHPSATPFPVHPDEVLFPVHPLAVDEVRRAGGRVLDEGRGTVRPVASMRAVEIGPRTHLVLPLPVSVLGTRDRLRIEPGRLGAGARAESLLRELADDDVLVAGEQEYAGAGHDCLAWMVRRLPEGRRIPVTALTQPHVEDGLRSAEVLGAYVRVLLRWGVRLLVEYGVVPEIRWHEVALVLDDHDADVCRPVTVPDEGADRGAEVRRRVKVLVQGHDGVLVSPARLAAAGVTVPELPEWMLTDDPHALTDTFVTRMLHLGTAAIVFALLPAAEAAALLRRTLEEALHPYGELAMARLLRARTLEAVRLTGRPWLTTGTLASEARLEARPPRMSGPNYLRLT